MATSPVATPAAPLLMNPIKRIFGVFFSPKATFQDIVRKPSWVAPMAVLIFISIGLSVSLARHANWIEISKDQIAKSKFASRQIDQLTDDQKATAYQQAAQRSKIIRYARGVVGWPMLLLVSAAIYLGFFKLIGGARINFVTAFAITAFAHLPMGLKELISIPVVFFEG
jgi:Yip1 domain